MISRAEASTWAARLGVDTAQVARDHLVSCILTWLEANEISTEVTFIGGTALARTHLDGVRMSEDIDLLASDPRRVATGLIERLARGLRREYPALSVPTPQPGPRGLVLHVETPDTLPVQVQILKIEPAESTLATAVIPVSVRYARLPATVDLRVPIPASFVAMKVAAYRDRAEPRDLFDLARLADRGHLTAEARDATRLLTAATPTAREFASLPTAVRDRWNQRLAHQLADPGTAEQAVTAVIDALRALEAARAEQE